jgi:PTH1 family peptidyl-tRNA hydrolase
LIENLASYFGKSFSSKPLFSYFKSSLEKKEVIGIIPKIFVNDSGRAVKLALNEFGGQLIVIHDELDISFGDIKIKKSGSSGGHNGVQSVISYLGTEYFWRVRIGIGRPPLRKEPADFVLEVFKKIEQKELPFMLEQAKEVLLDIIKYGPEWAMNKYH